MQLDFCAQMKHPFLHMVHVGDKRNEETWDVILFVNTHNGPHINARVCSHHKHSQNALRVACRYIFPGFTVTLRLFV